MNRRLVNMTEQESFALVEAQNQDKTVYQKHFKKIKADRSDTQQILGKRSPRRIVHTDSILDNKNDLTKN
ncbi:unnamed protein product [Macrosiphum euphorbiae]|uniref:Uncharacterized protein n=1 Tax=Macrosiphum euphorbiae TaxID=13131 RepID=A0AAV0X9W2_9HEMI|nr:unnamed protein product [Macrosiphum euphorbiae]